MLSYVLEGRVRIRRLSVLVLVGLLAATAHAQFSFAPASNIATPARPDGVASADFNGDGIDDLAITRDDPDRVSVMMGLGGGSFGPPVDYLTGDGTGPGAIVAANLDGDSDIDLAVTLHGTDQVRVLINVGGAFALGSVTNVGADPRAIVAGRIDANGSVDLVTANRGSNDVSVLLNTGSATFSSTPIAVGQDPRGVALADFTGDGVLDVAVTNHHDRTISVLRNTGAGALVGYALLSVGAELRPEGITAGDFNRDGRMDIAPTTSGNGLNFASVFLNTGTGFGAIANYATGGLNPGAILASDQDCDGRLDLAVVNQDSGTLTLLKGTATGTFGAAQLLTTGTTPEKVTRGDFDNDGDWDLAVANRDSDSVSVLLNTGCQFLIGDMNCDRQINFADIDPFVLAVGGQTDYAAVFPQCRWTSGDINLDGVVNFADIDPFVDLMANP